MTNEPEGKCCNSQFHDNDFLLKEEEAKWYAGVSDKEFGTWIDEVDADFYTQNVYALSNTFYEDEDVPGKLFIHHVNKQEKIMLHMNEKINFQSEVIAELQKDNSK
eukprot:3003424-Ditylum_brightwellii.AAC.1